MYLSFRLQCSIPIHALLGSFIAQGKDFVCQVMNQIELRIIIHPVGANCNVYVDLMSQNLTEFNVRLFS